jgi:translocation protein SEC63
MALDYDNSAFYYFTLTLLAFYVIPTTWYVTKSVMAGMFGMCREREAFENLTGRTEAERRKLAKLKEKRASAKTLLSTKFVVHSILLILAYVICFNIVTRVQIDSDLATYDPFAVLGIEKGASPREIKRAYHKMSLKYHPDKNKGNQDAAEKMIAIIKANEALTDPTARENFEKYGNPDGPKRMEVSIGLPTFLQDAENHNVVMAIYLLILIVLIPGAVCCWYNNSQKHGDGGVLNESFAFYYDALSENVSLSKLPEILALSTEYRRTKCRFADQKTLTKLIKRMKQHDTLPDLSKKYDNKRSSIRARFPSLYKTYILIHAYLNREKLDKLHAKDLEGILQNAHRLIDAMLRISTYHRWVQTTVNLIQFSQMITQGVAGRHPELALLQLPHFTEREIAHCGSKKERAKVTLRKWISEKKEDRKGMNDFSSAEKDEVDSICRVIPDLKMDLTVTVDADVTILRGDINLLERPEDEGSDDLLKTFGLTNDLVDELGSDSEDEREEEAMMAKNNNGEGETNDALMSDKLKVGDIVEARMSKKSGIHKGRVVGDANWRSGQYKIKFDHLICEGDFITINAKITRQNLPDTPDSKAPPVFSTQYPFSKSENLLLLLVYPASKKLISLEVIKDQGRVVEKKMTFQAPAKGKYDFDLILMSDSYIGIDQTQQVSIKVESQDILPKFKAHKEDEDLDNELSVFELAMGYDEQEADSDFESDSDEEQANMTTAQLEALHGSTGRGGQRKVKAEDADSDFSDEDDNAEEEEGPAEAAAEASTGLRNRKQESSSSKGDNSGDISALVTQAMDKYTEKHTGMGRGEKRRLKRQIEDAIRNGKDPMTVSIEDLKKNN